MSKYIDKDKLWERLKKHMVRHIVTNTLFNTIKAVIDSMPTIDIVHCGECIHCIDEVIEETIPIYIYCDLWKSETEWGSFCSYGERTEE